MEKYNPKKIEKKWQKIWQETKLANVDLTKAKKPFYNLMMFPYPSGEGLHIGHAYSYSGADAFGRFKKMQGFDVFEPMGFDAFGIHAENYALKINQHPKAVVRKTTKNFRQQMDRLGIMFDWEKEVNTTEPEYYKWTQWLFLQLFKRRLAYKKEAPVNWCPSCKTVLADEQVIAGKCERCSTVVIERHLKQWFFKITHYADKLDKNLANIDWSEKVKVLQKNWIGRSEGAVISFYIPHLKKELKVFTSRPDTIFGATFIAIALEHALVNDLVIDEKKLEFKKFLKKIAKFNRDFTQKEKFGFFTGSYAINPINKEKIPIWITNYVLKHYGEGAIMGVPAHDQRDFEFAKKYHIEIRQVVVKEIMAQSDKIFCYEGEGYLKDSGQFSGMTTQEAQKAIISFLAKNKLGGKSVTYKIRDWLISRQRYWGPPIPIIYCQSCRQAQKADIIAATQSQSQKKLNKNKKLKFQNEEGIDYTIIDGVEYAIVPLPEKDLPLKLPFVENFRPTGTGKSPLASVENFIRTKCPRCFSEAIRETDVTDNFLDSAWYYIGYLLKFKNWQWEIESPAFAKLMRRWLPVDMYIGGAEHSVLHLLYTRFIMMALKDMGLVHFDEPFKKFRAHGLITKDGAKMSKSKGNVVNPMNYIEKFGADTLRMYLLFLGPYDQGGDFSDKGISGVVRFLNRLWKLAHTNLIKESDKTMKKIDAQAIKNVTEFYESLKFNVVVSELMKFLNAIEQNPNKKSLLILLKLLAPICPHISEELWQFLQNEKIKIKKFKSIFQSGWPNYQEKDIIEKAIKIAVQINGKLRDVIEVPFGISEKEIITSALKSPKIKKWLEGKEIIKTFYIKDRLVNFLIK